MERDLLDTQNSKVSACIYPYQHIPISRTANKDNTNNKIELATQLYDIKLQYYAQAMQWAHPTYGYHSLGSTIAVNFLYYCAVGGFPKKSAAEDFYLLNKLAKVGIIKNLIHPTLLIQARESLRVPFGTGPALNDIMNLENPNTQFLFYDPINFIVLKHLLLSIKKTWLTETFKSHHLVSKECQLNTKEQQAFYQALEKLNINQNFNATSKALSVSKKWVQSVDQWFDGFKSLKFIHLLRDHGIESLTLKDFYLKMTTSSLLLESDLMENIQLYSQYQNP